ncbi:unnamed protein product [Polarella glacialis]|uniref:Protein arginine N-methyltransferase domain-containing protein n=1 Tax=Polarella glacialis TaxID=89957 RepID=A0A813JMM9_POLGL|nr:unnamed protein product [Polarella glacialis]
MRCNNQKWAETAGFLTQVGFFGSIDDSQRTFYDAQCGLPLFVAPKGRSFADFKQESTVHGWPSFRDGEVVIANVIELLGLSFKCIGDCVEHGLGSLWGGCSHILFAHVSFNDALGPIFGVRIRAHSKVLSAVATAVLPTVAELFVAPFTDTAMGAERQRFWSDIGGVDMTCLLPEVTSEFTAEPRIEGMAFDQLLGEPICLWRHDFRDPAPPERQKFSKEASWRCPDGATAHGYVGWFDCHFDPRSSGAASLAAHSASSLQGQALASCVSCAFRDKPALSSQAGYRRERSPEAECQQQPAKVPRSGFGVARQSTLSTAPGAPRTHWHHTLFFFREPVLGGTSVRTKFQVTVDDGAKGWVSLRADQDLGSSGKAPVPQTWLLRSYARDGMPAPPLPTARTWLYDLAGSLVGHAKASP